MASLLNESQEHLLERIIQFDCQIPLTGLAPNQYRPSAFLLTMEDHFIADLKALIRRSLVLLQNLAVMLDREQVFAEIPASLSRFLHEVRLDLFNIAFILDPQFVDPNSINDPIRVLA